MQFDIVPDDPSAVYWYRVRDGRYASALDEWERPVGDGVPYIHVDEFKVLRETPHGVWLERWMEPPRFVLRSGRKRFACPTFEEACESFFARKRRQADILRAQLRHVERVLKMTPINPSGRSDAV